MKCHYIVCMRDDNLRLIGPFDNNAHLWEWVTANNPKDDPRWQQVILDDDDAGWPMGPGEFLIRVFAPSEGPMPD